MHLLFTNHFISTMPPAPLLLSTGSPKHPGGEVHDGKRTKFSSLGENKFLWCWEFLFLSFFFICLLFLTVPISFLHCLLLVYWGWNLYSFHETQDPGTKLILTKNVGSFVCIFHLNGILDSFCFFLI